MKVEKQGHQHKFYDRLLYFIEKSVKMSEKNQASTLTFSMKVNHENF